MTTTLDRAAARRSARRLATAAPWPALCLAALAAVALAGFVAFPTYPNYDSYYSLLWGKEAVHGTLPSFAAYRAATPHPLAIALGMLLAPLGSAADRLLVGATIASFVALAAGLYRFAAVSYTRLVGLLAAALLCSRFDLPFLAARAYIDIPYLALVVWAAALEAARPRRGTPVFLLLAGAGLLRPEAWLLAGLYWLWCAVPATWGERVRAAMLCAVGPVVWSAVDLAVTGNPMFSLTHTSGLAEELGRARGAGDLPAATVAILKGLDKAPVLYAGVLGMALAVVLFPRRSRVALAVLLAGLATFAIVVAAGLSVISRYLLVPAIVLLVFAAVTAGGWTMLRAGGRIRTAWTAVAAVGVLGAVAFTATHVNLGTFATELRFRSDYHASLQTLLRDPRVAAARRCGPVSLPNHKLIAEVRWITGAGESGVVARSDATQAARIRRGVAIYALGDPAFARYGFDPDPVTVALPMSGFRRVATTRYFSAYVRC
jgi:hypothetical protein